MAMLNGTDEEKFKEACEQAIEFPESLVFHNTHPHIIQWYENRVSGDAGRLFVKEEDKKASVDVWDYRNDDEKKGFENTTLRGVSGTLSHFNILAEKELRDPRCRFVFIHAPHSRERLKCTREQFMAILTYHQVMPNFLDFIFPFGKQRYAQDFNYSGFYLEDRLSDGVPSLKLPGLDRSGLDFRMCYNLKSVEPSKGQTHWPWSIRHTAVYHSFDIETGCAFWIIVKGDQLIKRRMQKSTNGNRFRNTESYGTLPGAFAATLMAHLVMFQWCREHWRWYTNFLEEQMQSSTREAFLVDFEPQTRKLSSPTDLPKPPSIPNMLSTSSTAVEGEKSPRSPQCSDPTPPVPRQYPNPPPRRLPSRLVNNPFSDSKSSLYPGDEFSFADLQRVQNLEDKANEALHVLESNIIILRRIIESYQDIIYSAEFPLKVKEHCAGDINRFSNDTTVIINDLEMQVTGTRMLLRLLGDRKALLNGILNFQSMQSNRLFARKAQLSSENMESLTEDMHTIAQKTKQETVSMRIITLVTLFFLPGTFISTLMSTDIVRFQQSPSGGTEKQYHPGALALFLQITLPMMVVTFASWYGVYLYVDRKSRAKLTDAEAQ